MRTKYVATKDLDGDYTVKLNGETVPAVCGYGLNSLVELTTDKEANDRKFPKKIVFVFLKSPTENTLEVTYGGSYTIPKVVGYDGGYFPHAEDIMAVMYTAGYRYIQVEIA
jgi:hypothetical protein